MDITKMRDDVRYWSDKIVSLKDELRNAEQMFDQRSRELQDAEYKERQDLASKKSY